VILEAVLKGQRVHDTESLSLDGGMKSWFNEWTFVTMDMSMNKKINIYVYK